MTAEDRETRAAIDALVFRLRNRGDADDEPFAQEFILALKLRGWRPTEARPSPDWKMRGQSSGRLSDADREKLRADMAAATERRAAEVRARALANRDDRDGGAR